MCLLCISQRGSARGRRIEQHRQQRRGLIRRRLTFGSDRPVQRGALLRLPAKRSDDAIHLVRRHFLTVLRAGRARNALVHQRAAEIVGAGLQTSADAFDAELDPRGLDVGHERMQHQPAHRMHQDGFARGRPLAGLAAIISRRLAVNERQRHELGEAAGAFLKIADVEQMTRPIRRLSPYGRT